MSGFLREFIRSDILQILFLPQPFEELSKLGIYVLGVAEHAAALAQTHRAEGACPMIDVLKEVMMYRLIVGWRRITYRQRLFASLRHRISFKGFQIFRIP